MKQIGFSNEKYLNIQSEQIRKRIGQFGGKLYMEFGGKLFDDHHASRVLPGFQPDSKLKMLLKLRDQVEIVIAISADAISSGKSRDDLGITYDNEVLRLIDLFRSVGLYVGSVNIVKYDGQKAADAFIRRLQTLNIPVFRSYPIEGYPSDVERIVSDEGFGRNDYIETTRSLIVVTAPGPGSGKMATCLSQLYHEHKRGIQAGYAKFETFPIWNLPLNHPVNLAYEAATADLGDVNMIDPFHLEAYNQVTVNYNRDVEIYPVLSATFERIYGKCPYKSPTDMGVNMAGYCITDDAVCCEASRQEILRRYYNTCCGVRAGTHEISEVRKIEMLMSKANVRENSRAAAVQAMKVAEETCEPAASIELLDGRVITGKNKELLGASSAMLLNALKALAGIDDHVTLISSEVIEPVQRLKVNYLGNQNPRLHMDEVLIALSICAATDENAAKAMNCLPQLAGCEAHSSVILSSADENIYRKLKINLTCEPRYESKRLFHA